MVASIMKKRTIIMVSLLCGRVLSERALRLLLVLSGLKPFVCFLGGGTFSVDGFAFKTTCP